MYSIRKDGKYFSEVRDNVPIFNADQPIMGEVYLYPSLLIAEDIAGRFNAEVVAINSHFFYQEGTKSLK